MGNRESLSNRLIKRRIKQNQDLREDPRYRQRVERRNIKRELQDIKAKESENEI